VRDRHPHQNIVLDDEDCLLNFLRERHSLATAPAGARFLTQSTT
jgi:hypothetical protein